MLNRNIFSVVAALSALAVATTAAFATCYICGYTCELLEGSACSSQGKMKICEDSPDPVGNGTAGSHALTLSWYDAKCWTFDYQVTWNWAQGPCTEGPPPGNWHLVPTCDLLEEGKCCWTDENWEDDPYDDGGFQIQHCKNEPCPVGYPS